MKKIGEIDIIWWIFSILVNFLFMLWFHEHLVYGYSNPPELNNPYYTIRKNISDRVHKPCVFFNKNRFSAVFHRPDKCIVLHQNGSKCVVLGQKLRKNLFHIGCKEKFGVDWGLHDAVWCALLKIKVVYLRGHVIWSDVAWPVN